MNVNNLMYGQQVRTAHVVIIDGRVAKVEPKEFQKDNKSMMLTQISLAVQQGNQTIWFRATAWNRLATTALSLRSGQIIRVVGTLNHVNGEPRVWKDQKTGQARATFEVTVTAFQDQNGNEWNGWQQAQPSPYQRFSQPNTQLEAPVTPQENKMGQANNAQPMAEFESTPEDEFPF